MPNIDGGGEPIPLLKQRLNLLEYLQQRHWPGRPIQGGREWVGLCPLHREHHPSFYVNPHKNVFYCHGCGRGGDLIRFVQLSANVSFSTAVQQLSPHTRPPVPPAEPLLAHAVQHYQQQLLQHPPARQYLVSRGLHEQALIEQLRIGYAPGASVRAYLTALGYSRPQIQQAGLIDDQGRDTFYRRLVFPFFGSSGVDTLYSRWLGDTPGHRVLARPKTQLFAWDRVRLCQETILVEGLFDLAALWQAGFRNTTCALGTHLSAAQLHLLCDRPGRLIYIAFDNDDNQAGSLAAAHLAARLAAAGLTPRLVLLPDRHDPSSLFAHGANASDFTTLLRQAKIL